MVITEFATLPFNSRAMLLNKWFLLFFTTGVAWKTAIAYPWQEFATFN